MERGWKRCGGPACALFSTPGTGWCRAFLLPPPKPTLTQTDSVLQTLLFWDPPPRVLGPVLGTKIREVRTQAGACRLPGGPGTGPA